MTGKFHIPEEEVRDSDDNGIERRMIHIGFAGINADSMAGKNIGGHAGIPNAVKPNVMGELKQIGAQAEPKKTIEKRPRGRRTFFGIFHQNSAYSIDWGKLMKSFLFLLEYKDA